MRALAGTLIICAVEFTVGFIVNILLDWKVWDYSGRKYNIYGQICPIYAFLWFLLCIPGNRISGKLYGVIKRMKLL